MSSFINVIQQQMYSNRIRDAFQSMTQEQKDDWIATVEAIRAHRPYTNLKDRTPAYWSTCKDCGCVRPIEDCICELDYVF